MNARHAPVHPRLPRLLGLALLQAGVAMAQADPAAAAPARPSALVTFSADAKYETPDGTPLPGTPRLCAAGSTVARPADDAASPGAFTVDAGREIVVTSSISWTNTGFLRTCAPQVAFVPEAGASYVVVNQRIGGKGFRALWTGIGRQTCAVFVYRLSENAFERVATRDANASTCTAAGG